MYAPDLAPPLGDIERLNKERSGERREGDIKRIEEGEESPEGERKMLWNRKLPEVSWMDKT